jgi:hypothetical protein
MFKKKTEYICCSEFIENSKAKKENFEYIYEIIKYTESLEENEFTNFKTGILAV